MKIKIFKLKLIVIVKKKNILLELFLIELIFNLLN